MIDALQFINISTHVLEILKVTKDNEMHFLIGLAMSSVVFGILYVAKQKYDCPNVGCKNIKDMSEKTKAILEILEANQLESIRQDSSQEKLTLKVDNISSDLNTITGIMLGLSSLKNEKEFT